jgi:hypothetical protein
MDEVRAKLVYSCCPECLNALLEECNSRGGLPLSGEVVLIPEHWLNHVCGHGHLGIKFERLRDETDAPVNPKSVKSGTVDSFDTRMDATKDIGYPVREHGTYGTHPMHDDFNDESNSDGSGNYPGLKRR